VWSWYICVCKGGLLFVDGVIVKEGNWRWIERCGSCNWDGAVAKLRRREKGKRMYCGGVVDNIKDK